MATGILHRTILTRIVSLSSKQLHQHRSIQSVAVFSSIRHFNIRQEGSHVCTSRHLHGSSALSAKKGRKHQTKVDVNRSVDDSILDLQDVHQDMKTAIDALKQSYIKTLNIRTSQGVLDHIQVSTNDGKFSLNQLGQITAKSSNMMSVNMTSFPEATQAAVKAIRECGMNLNPQVTGSLIQVPIPKVTKEHREQLAKQAKVMCDKSKVSVRQIRSNYISKIKKHKDSASKDTLFILEKQIGQIADVTIENAEQLLTGKTKELLGK
ncbi:ribosome-recycling factor, mitochondrial-like [Asterias amurensis]|uniref:ribosome-recycling factor, mitochondrial-like n=1 Tax=Asterias amurensis TaxID=7602 RepID=UPI003AB5E10E